MRHETFQDFDAFVGEMLASGFKSRLLYVFLGLTQAHPLDPHGFPDRPSESQVDAWVDILFTAHEICTADVSFHSLAELADTQDRSWSVLVTQALGQDDMSLPSEAAAEFQIESMCAEIRSGHVADMAFFDRNGGRINPAQVARVAKPALMN